MVRRWKELADEKDIRAALNRAGNRCEWCGSKDRPGVDHVIPKSKGGSHTLSNFQVLCNKCGCWKTELMPSEVIKRMEKLKATSRCSRMVKSTGYRIMKEWQMKLEQMDKAKSLLARAGVDETTISTLDLGTLRAAIDVAADLVGEKAPDATWFREYYEITGDHMVLTEDGWIPAEFNTREITGEDPAEVIEEVNAPTASI